MKKILKMSIRRLPRRPPPTEALRAKAAASTDTYDDEEDYEVEEPNMKFSHALIVVLALHIIAVGGVFAFNSIKAGQSPSSKASTKREATPSTAQATVEPKPSPAQPVGASGGRTYTVQAGDTLSRIASLHKVAVEAIEKENGITSYSMIRVGQVLKIPAAPAQRTEAPKLATDPATAAAKHAFLATRTDLAAPSASPVAKTAAPAAQTDAAKAHAAAAKPLTTVAATPKPASAQPSPKKVDESASSSNPDVYVVAKGDNPYSIAKKFHVSYNELIAINDIKDPTRVQIGQKLKIPAKKN